MAEHEIDKEDVHERRNVNVMKRKSNPIGKRTINRLYIYIYTVHEYLHETTTKVPIIKLLYMETFNISLQST